jgi:hypothetical protein
MSTPRANLEVFPRSVRLVLWLGLAALATFPFVGGDFYVQMVTRMMILAIFAMSLDLLQGVSGLVSLGHAAFVAVGAYAHAWLLSKGVPLLLSLPLSGLLCVISAQPCGCATAGGEQQAGTQPQGNRHPGHHPHQPLAPCGDHSSHGVQAWDCNRRGRSQSGRPLALDHLSLDPLALTLKGRQQASEEL